MDTTNLKQNLITAYKKMKAEEARHRSEAADSLNTDAVNLMADCYRHSAQLLRIATLASGFDLLEEKEVKPLVSQTPELTIIGPAQYERTPSYQQWITEQEEPAYA